MRKGRRESRQRGKNMEGTVRMEKGRSCNRGVEEWMNKDGKVG